MSHRIAQFSLELQLTAAKQVPSAPQSTLQDPPLAHLPVIGSALAAAGNERARVQLLPGLNHLFQHAETGLPSEYAAIEETFAPEALDLIADWIADL